MVDESNNVEDDSELRKYILASQGIMSMKTAIILKKLRKFSWLERRRGYITSSNYCQIVSMVGTPSSFATNLLIKKIGLRWGTQSLSNRRRRIFFEKKQKNCIRGNFLEEKALQKFETEFKIPLVLRKFTKHRYLIHPRFTFLASTVDAITLDGHLVEVKAPRQFRAIFMTEWTQLQFDLHVFNLSKCYYIQIVGEEIRVVEYKKKEGFLIASIEILQNFYLDLYRNNFENLNNPKYLMGPDGEMIAKENLLQILQLDE